MQKAQENALVFTKNYVYITKNGGDYSSALFFP